MSRSEGPVRCRVVALTRHTTRLSGLRGEADVQRTCSDLPSLTRSGRRLAARHFPVYKRRPMQLQLIFKFVLLLAIANGTPIIAERVLGRSLAYPLDGGTNFIDGHALLGPY